MNKFKIFAFFLIITICIFHIGNLSAKNLVRASINDLNNLILNLSPKNIVISKLQTKDTIQTRKIKEVVVNTKRLPNKINSTTPIQILNSESIHTMGLQSVADAVKHFTGVTVRDYGGIGGLKTVSIRSLGAHHTGISYDGIAISNTQAGQIDISRFSIDDISLLTLSVGQSDNLLQAARLYSSAAVLSIQTESPKFNGDLNYNFKAQLKMGSFGEINPSFKYSRKFNNSTSISIDGNFTRADGNYPFTLQNGKYSTKEKRYNSSIVSLHNIVNFYHTFKNNGKLNIKSYYFNSKRELPGVVILYNNHNHEKLWDENYFLQASYKNRINSKWELLTQAKYNYSRNKYKKEDVANEANTQIDINKQNEYYISGAVLYHPSSHITTSLAQDFSVNTLENNLLNNQSPVRYSSFTALNIKFKFGRFTSIINLLNTYMHETVETGDKPSDKEKFTPSFSAIYKLLDKQNLNIRALYKKTYRVPSFNDLYYLRMGNTALKPELADEYNLGFTWNGSISNKINYISVSVDGFYNKVNDKIVAFPSTYVWKMRNYGKVRIHGLEANLAMNIFINSDFSLNLRGGYTYQKAIDKTDPLSKNYKDQLPYTPKNSSSASAIFKTSWGDLAYNFIQVGVRYALEQNIPINEIDGYLEHSISLTKEFKIKNTAFDMQLQCLNFTDKQYDIINYYPMPGRSFKATIKINI